MSDNIEKRKELISSISEDTARSFILNAWIRTTSVKEQKQTAEQFSQDMVKLFDQLESYLKRANNRNVGHIGHVAQPVCKRLHVAFGLSSAGSLRAMLDTDEDQVLTTPEHLEVGPIWQLHKMTGLRQRCEWLYANMSHVPDDEVVQYEMRTWQQLTQRLRRLPEHIEVVIWCGDNAHEQVGLRLVLYLLRQQTNNVHVIHATRAFPTLFNTPDVSYDVRHVGEIGPDKLKAIWEQYRGEPTLTKEQREQLAVEWESLAERCEHLRMWKDKQIVHTTVDELDAIIIEVAKRLHFYQEYKGFIKSARLIGEVIGESDQYIGDIFLQYRLRSLIESGIFDVEGDMTHMRTYSVRLCFK
ncbi:DUF1835 domain-containing protein [Paenibacillus sp. 481]|uniref:DUF1835 domain-containing protein n=1 Tax=Paenibacillus sp. 481 TaxID=2835869 RepID=UPI001E3F20EF|nr:DUF1835 domain-containing protein [Paenibacillus sp. 481]UHA73611.1 DUF1835 domain-containing protein [Paenibacillus sp. 481]